MLSFFLNRTGRTGVLPPQLLLALCLAAALSGCDTGVSPKLPPLPPGNVIAAPTFNQIDLTWTASSGADGYIVYYSAAGSPAAALTLRTAAAKASITGLAGSAVYHIRVKAHNSAGTGDYSAAATARTSDPLPAAFYDSTWFSSYYDGYIIADYGTDKPAAERWELTYNDGWTSSPSGGTDSYGFMGFIKYVAAQTPAGGESDAGVIILEYHDEDYAPLGAWEDSGAPSGRGRFGAVYYHTLTPGVSVKMGNANKYPVQNNVEETTLKAAVDTFGPPNSIDTYSNTSTSVEYDYAAL
jgi:hypothetical protein